MKIWSLKNERFPKNDKMGIFGQYGDTYAIVGRPSNLIVQKYDKINDN
jgi:hypothetical protein